MLPSSMVRLPMRFCLINEEGFWGIFTGGFKAAAGGVTAAMIFGVLAALLFKPKDKS